MSRQVLALHQATPGQAASRARKKQAKLDRDDRHAVEAANRNIPISHVPRVLQQEMNDAAKARRQETTRLA